MASGIASGQGVGISYVWGKLAPTARDTIWVDREPLLATVFGTKTDKTYPKRHQKNEVEKRWKNDDRK